MLTRNEVKSFYNKFGSKQDLQSLYEKTAIAVLISNGKFHDAESIFELGCGTGKFAVNLLEKQLGEKCEYFGIDSSETMIGLSRERLLPFAARASLHLSSGSLRLPVRDNSYDRFVSNFVLDLLGEKEIGQVFLEANRVLRKSGLLCLASLSHGQGVISNLVSTLWESVHRRYPTLVGGCRPLELIRFVDKDIWDIIHNSKVSSFGITSEILIARKLIGKSSLMKSKRQIFDY